MTNREVSSSRRVEIDLLRALAILLVLGRHILVIPQGDPSFLKSVLLIWKRCGWMGVDLFFVISGFLVSGLLFKEYQLTGGVHPLRFLIRRAFKIYPAFYFFLILGTWPIYKLTGTSFSFRGLWGEVFFLQNYVGTLWLHTWSLAIEEHFYLLLAAVVFLASTLRKNSHPFGFIPTLFVVVGLFLLIARIFLGYGLSRTWGQILLYTHLRIDSLLFGVFLSYWHYFHFQRFRTWIQDNRALLLILSFLFLCPAFFLDLEAGAFMYTIGLTLLYLAFGGILMTFLYWESGLKEKITSRLGFFTLIGRQSYSIYLWHIAAYIVTFKISRALFRDWFVPQLFLYIMAALLVGISMAYLIEQPFLKFRDKTFPRIQ